MSLQLQRSQKQRQNPRFHPGFFFLLLFLLGLAIPSFAQNKVIPKPKPQPAAAEEQEEESPKKPSSGWKVVDETNTETGSENETESQQESQTESESGASDEGESGAEASETAEADETPAPTIEELRKELPDGWMTSIEPAGEIFPSLILALANVPKAPDQPEEKEAEVIGSDDGWISALVLSPKADSKIRLTVRCPELMNDSTIEATLPKADSLYSVRPTILWKFDVLRSVKQSVPAHVVFELTLDGKTLPTKPQRVRIRTINDCPYFDSNDDDPIDMSWMFAAFVNEDHPIVDQILKEALGTKAIESFSGYQAGESVEVFRQVFSIWWAIRRRGIKYSSITTTAASSERLHSQHVRFLDESLGNIQANCVDGSVLFASILRKIGIDPLLCVTPTHCFLGFALDPEGKKKAFIETTCIGMSEPEEVNVLSKVAESYPDKVTEGDAWKSFQNAFEAGRAQFREHKEEFKGNSPDYQLVDIEASRKAGIMPIARP